MSSDVGDITIVGQPASREADVNVESRYPSSRAEGNRA